MVSSLAHRCTRGSEERRRKEKKEREGGKRRIGKEWGKEEGVVEGRVRFRNGRSGRMERVEVEDEEGRDNT